MSELPEQEAVQLVNQAFMRWEVPRFIKIDNGRPFVHPSNMDIPTLSVLWWIGLGAEVIRNDPGCPQQNATVEGLQDTCYRWAVPADQENPQALQASLDEAGRIQREVYQIARKGYKTRIQLYPELETNPRKFSPALFDMKRVFQYLSEQVWERKVKKRGSVKFFGQEIYVGYKFAHWPVTITYDPLEHQWVIRATDGRLLKTSDKGLVTEEQIWKHVNMSKN